MRVQAFRIGPGCVSDVPPLTLDKIGRHHRNHEFDRQRPYNPTSRTRIGQDGIEVGRGRLWNGILIDTSARWSKDPDVVVEVHYRIERTIRRNHNGVTYCQRQRRARRGFMGD